MADVKLLACGIKEANAYWSGGGADLERLATSLLEHLEMLPARIADAIADALAKQHRMIIADVHAALGEFGARHVPSSPPGEPAG